MFLINLNSKDSTLNLKENPINLSDINKTNILNIYLFSITPWSDRHGSKIIIDESKDTMTAWMSYLMPNAKDINGINGRAWVQKIDPARF